MTVAVASPSRSSTQPAEGAVRTGVIGTMVAALAFFDGVVLGAPVAILAASFRPLIVYVVATTAAIALTTASCRWVDRRWDDWLSGNANRMGKRLDAMRTSRLMRHPVGWIERGSDRWYALAAAVCNPILVLAIARSISGKPVGERRVLLGSVAYAIPYVAMWSLVGLALGESIRRA
jgi:hypothetical protein